MTEVTQFDYSDFVKALGLPKDAYITGVSWGQFRAEGVAVRYDRVPLKWCRKCDGERTADCEVCEGTGIE